MRLSHFRAGPDKESRPTQRPPGLSPQGASKLNFPNGIYLTPGARMPRFKTPGVVSIPLDIPGIDF